MWDVRAIKEWCAPVLNINKEMRRTESREAVPGQAVGKTGSGLMIKDVLYIPLGYIHFYSTASIIFTVNFR